MRVRTGGFFCALTPWKLRYSGEVVVCACAHGPVTPRHRRQIPLSSHGCAHAHTIFVGSFQPHRPQRGRCPRVSSVRAARCGAWHPRPQVMRTRTRSSRIRHRRPFPLDRHGCAHAHTIFLGSFPMLRHPQRRSDSETDSAHAARFKVWHPRSPGCARAHTIQPNPPSAAIPTRSTWLCARAHYFRRVFPAHDDTCTVPGLRGAFRACRSIRGMAAPGCAHAHTVEPARHRH